MLAMKGKRRVVQGGTSAGKTFGLVVILADRAIRTPGLEISIVGPTIPHLKKGALKDFKKALMMLNRWDENRWHGGDSKYTFTNGSYVEFFSADQPDKVKGPRRDVLYINECDLVPFQTYHALMIRTAEEVWLDFNPTHEFWVHKEVLKDPEAEFLKLTYQDNEALSSSILREIESARDKPGAYWQNWWKVYGLGEIGSLSGVCIPEWEEIAMPEEARLLCYGLDWGYSQDPSCLVAVYEYNGGYVFDEVFYKKGLLNSEISALLKSYEVNDMIWADSAEPKSIAELQAYGHLIEPAPKGPDSVRYGINLLNQNKIFVTNRSDNIKRELRAYTWMTNKDGEELPKPVDAFNHTIDCMRYALMGQLENPTVGQYHIY